MITKNVYNVNMRNGYAAPILLVGILIVLIGVLLLQNHSGSSNVSPKPENLILKEKKKRVTLTLTQTSLDFFKDAAKKHKASYQGMIRRLIDYYVVNQ